MRFRVVAYIGAFIPTEKVIIETRFEWLARKVAAYQIKRKYSTCPVKLIKIQPGKKDVSEWLNDWSKDHLDTQKKELEKVGEDLIGRCDLVEIEHDVIRGSAPVQTEIPEEQIIKEIAELQPKNEAPLPADEASRKLEIIRREMEEKKRKLKIILP